MSWRNESRRHQLASKGVKTTHPQFTTHGISNKKLEEFIVKWLDKNWREWNIGTKDKINDISIVILDYNRMSDPYATWRPQNLYYIMGRAGDKYWSIMFGSDEGLTPGWYEFDTADKPGNVKSLSEMLALGEPDDEFIEMKARLIEEMEGP